MLFKLHQYLLKCLVVALNLKKFNDSDELEFVLIFMNSLGSLKITGKTSIIIINIPKML